MLLESQANRFWSHKRDTAPSTWPNPFPLPGRWPAVRRKPLYKSSMASLQPTLPQILQLDGGLGSLEPPFLDNVSKKKMAVLREQKPCLVWRKLGMRKNKSCRHMLKTAYPPTPALAKAGAAPGTTAGVELVFLSFKCLNASRQIRSACRLPPQPSLVRALHAQPRAQKPHGHINGFLPVKQATPRPHPWLLLSGPACRSRGVTRFKPSKRLNILLACLIPQPTGTPRRHQWLLMGVQACRLPGLQRLKGLKPLKLCKRFSERPTAQAKANPRPHPWLLPGRSSLPFARRYTL